MSEAGRPLLLHSLAEFRSVIFRVLDLAEPGRVVELGGEGGLFTRELAEWGGAHGAEIHCIEPLPNDTLAELAADGAIQLTRGKSPDALAGLDPFDLYVIDGDHNHHVVSGELAAIYGARREGEPPVCVLHDVGWPAARRDQYYDPADVPAEHRHPYSYEGQVKPGEPGMVEHGGFHGAGAFAYALEEGGERNGVLTAVEDLLASRDDLELIRIPAIFGLGILFPSAAPFAAALREEIGPFHENDLIDRLEQNRLALFLHTLELQERLQRLDRGRSRLIASLEDEVGRVSAENAALELRLAQLDPVRPGRLTPPPD